MPTDSPGGHCARCLLLFAIEPEDDGEADEDSSTADESLPEVDGCRVLEKIGEGGCGIVYRAEQMEPVRREVALKVIKLGMDTRQVIARFDGERQALALMDHPSIAKVFSAGSTRAGRPCFLMELVRGVPITKYCDEKNLATRERIRLFIEVCRAVQHAHQKGVIHRDIKPSNVLVTERDGQPVPKVIDFGIAKATGDQRLTDETFYTAFEQFIGTPAYMSPEQAGAGTDIDTRSDVYSLGVLLYELLTGSPPYDPQEISAAAIDKIRRRIREEEPPRPSAKLAAMRRETLTVVASRRATEPRKLATTIRGDLDWIVMKALEKDRARRYATANGLVEDLTRHLRDEPVSARPPGAVYQLQKFARRHKTTVTAAATVFLILVAAAALSTWEAVRARRAEKIALTESIRSSQNVQFLEDMLASLDPAVAKGQDTAMLRSILDQAAARIDRDLRFEPEVAAPLHQTIGWSYHKIAEDAPAEEHLRAAVRLYRTLPDQEINLSIALSWLALASHTRKEEIAREAFAHMTKLMDTLPKNSREAGFLANRTCALGTVLLQNGKTKEAEQVIQRWLDFQRATIGDEAPAFAGTLKYLGQVEEKRRNFTAAGDCYRRALEILRKNFGDEDVGVASARRTFGQFLMNTGDFAGADALLRQSLALNRKYLGSTHPYIALNLGDLSALQVWRGQLGEARSLLSEAMPLCAKASSGTNMNIFRQVQELASIFQKQGRYPEAESLLLEADTVERSFTKAEPTSYKKILQQLATLYREWNKPDQAAAWEQKLAAFEKK
jgi:tetratricopeptide (TPR) repeat protein